MPRGGRVSLGVALPACASGITVCERFQANDTGDEPKAIKSGADGQHCLYQASDIHRP